MCKDQHRSFAITSVLRIGRNSSLTNEKIDDVGGRMFLLYSNPHTHTRTEVHVPGSDHKLGSICGCTVSCGY